MTAPILALRAAILAQCGADADLGALLGGAATIWDEPPNDGQPVHAHFGPVDLSDWSTSSDRGSEQDLTIAVWGPQDGSAAVIAAASRIAALLDDAPLTLAGHRLVQLAVTSLDIRKDDETGLPHATVRLRATTEITA